MTEFKQSPTFNFQLWRTPGICLILAAITFAVFGQTMSHDFVDYDDSAYAYDNPVVAGGLSPKSVAWVFTHADCNFYHPLTMLSLMVDYQLHGLHAGGFLFTNVLLHTASVILLFLVLRQMTGAPWRSAFVAAVFAIHPLRVESVAWVAERKDVLGAFFFMLTLGAYVRYVRKPNSMARYLMVVVAFVLSLLSKPIALTLPFVLLLLDYWPLQRMESARRLILEKIPLLALAVAAGIVTVLAEGKAVTPLDNAPMLSRIGNAVVSYAVYLRQMVWPEGLAPFYPKPNNPVWTIALSFLLLALITAGVLAYGRKRRWLLVGWLWYLGMLAPMIGIVQVGTFAHADRYTYLPQIGIYVAITWLFAEWHASRAAFGGLMAGVVVLLMACAWKQTACWKNSESLWTHTLACTTNNDMVHYGMGDVFLQKEKYDDAIAQFQTALQIRPDYAEARNNLGLALFKKGKADDALAQYQIALQLQPGYVDARYNLGNVFLQKRQLDHAIDCYQKVLQLQPDNTVVHGNFGIALFQKGRTNDAIAQFQLATQLTPNDAEAHYNLGVALRQIGKMDQAIVCYQNALRIQPGYAAARYHLGLALLATGKMEEASSELQKALQLDPDNPQVQNTLAWLLATSPQAALRNGGKAVQLARQASAQAGGKNPFFLRTLAAAFAEVGQFDDARQTAQQALALVRAAGRDDMAKDLNSDFKRYEAGLPLHE